MMHSEQNPLGDIIYRIEEVVQATLVLVRQMPLLLFPHMFAPMCLKQKTTPSVFGCPRAPPVPTLTDITLIQECCMNIDILLHKYNIYTRMLPEN